MKYPYRYTQSRTSLPTIEWERLPVLGEAQRNRSRNQAIKRRIFGHVTFWIAVVAIFTAVIR